MPEPPAINCPHTLLKVTLPSGEEWMVDPAGSQYGFRDALLPYERYMREKRCQVVSQPSIYSWTETRDLDYFDTIPQMNVTRRHREGRKLEREARKHFVAFVDANAARELLEGSVVVFESAFGSFVDSLGVHMLGFGRKKFGSG